MITEHVSDKIWQPLRSASSEVYRQLSRSAAEEIRNPGRLVYYIWPKFDLKYPVKEALEARL